MSRYYSLTLSKPNGDVFVTMQNGLGFTTARSGTTFTSLRSDGSTDPNALQVEFDFTSYTFDQFQGNMYIKVWGVGLPMIGQAAQLAGANFTLSAGMQRGLPLATAAYQAGQSGVIAQGQVFQSFGNWTGVNQTLDLICYSGVAASSQNIAFYWPAGVSMAAAIKQTLQQAFSQYPNPIINISANLIQNSDQIAHYNSLSQFATYVQQKSFGVGRSQYGLNYPGVRIGLQGKTLIVFDGQGSLPTKTTRIVFQDIIGQPTWIGYQQISFATVLRADIQTGSIVQLPQGIGSPYTLTSPAAGIAGGLAQNNLAFSGSFLVGEIHHFASFRQPDADSWTTAITATAISGKVPTGTGYVESSPGFDAG